jgi:AcrR family transcriptional regulator
MALRMTGEARREQLLDATKEIVLAGGFHGVSIEAVARAAGITRPIVYAHFADLGALLDALVARESRRALAQLEAALPADLAGDLVAALRGYLEAVRADPGTWRLVLMPQEGAPRALHERIAAGRAAIVARLAAGLRPGAGPPDAELTAHMLSAYADEAARLTLTDPERYPVERILALTRWALDRLGR